MLILSQLIEREPSIIGREGTVLSICSHKSVRVEVLPDEFFPPNLVIIILRGPGLENGDNLGRTRHHLSVSELVS